MTGPRRFDDYCDPLGTMASDNAFYPKEDLASTGTAKSPCTQRPPALG